MTFFTDSTGLASSALALAGIASMISRVARINKNHRIVLSVIVAVTALVPFGDLPLAAYVRGVTGDLSITTLILILAGMLLPQNGWARNDTLGMTFPRERERTAGRGRILLLSMIVLAALLLYPLALGLGIFDPYRLGYGDPVLLGVLLFFTVLAFIRQIWLPASVLPLAVLAWAVGWYESANLWDYLLDPFLLMYAIGALLKRGVRTHPELQ